MTTKPYYADEHVQIFLGDCRDVLPHVDADVMVTDPPYGIAYHSDYKRSRGETPSACDRAVSIAGDDDTSLRDAAVELWGDRPALIFGSWKRPEPTGTRHVLAWEKGDHVGMGDISLPWRPNVEEIYVLGRGFVGRRGTSVLRYAAPVSWASKGRKHPHEKPVDLMRYLLGMCPPGVIVDPFMGSGTTLRAAKDLGRKAIGIEIEERYCEIAVQRLRQEVLVL
jgi:DNA modification methylase